MASLSAGVFKKLVATKQTGLGVKAPAASAGAQLFRRVTSTLDLAKTNYTSKEIRPSQQRSDMRHGIRSVAGTISGELSVGTYQGFAGSVLRNAWTATAPIVAAGLTMAGTPGAYTVTRTAGSYLTDGVKIGDVVQLSVGTLNAANISKNLLVIALTATVATVAVLNGSAMVAEGPITGCTVTVMGKKCWIPQSGHTRDYWTVEHNFSDIGQSEQFKDCVFGDMNIKLPSTGMATIDFPVKGIDMDTSTAAWFTAPLAASTGGILAAVNGAVYVQGIVVGYITAFNIALKGNMTTSGGIVGANVEPDIFPGAVDVTGTATVLFADAVMRGYFLNETEVSLSVAFTTNNTATADFQSITLPRVKFSGATKNDGETSLSLTMPFTALENIAGGAALSSLATTISIQDSQAV